MLTIKQLSKIIQHQPILKDITLDLTEGHLLICGKSGSGKSTLAKIIAGLDLDYTGQIKYNGISRTDTQTKRWTKQIQYVPQYQSNTLDYRKRVRDILLAPLKIIILILQLIKRESRQCLNNVFYLSRF